MRIRASLSLGILCFLALPLAAQPIQVSHWVPDADLVAGIESRIVYAGGPHRLADFDRYYAGTTSGMKMVKALYVLPEPGGPAPGLHLVEQLPAYSGACGEFDNYLDMDKDETTGIAACKTTVMHVFLPRKPYWAPDQAAVEAMEHGMTLPSLTSFRPGPLENYVRYYTGWTRDGHRLIEGKLFLESYARDKPGVHVVDYGRMWQLGMTGGGCGYIMTLYDADTQTFLSRQCYGLG